MQVVSDEEGLTNILGYDSNHKIRITDKNTGEVVSELPLADTKIISHKLKKLYSSKKICLNERVEALSDALKNINECINNNSDLPIIEAEETGITVIDFSFRWGGSTKSNSFEYACLTLGRDFENFFDDKWKHANGYDIFEQTKPLGTILNVTPNNDNVGVALKTFIDAIIAGCPVLFKPGIKAPTSLINIVSELKKFLPGYVDIFISNTKNLYQTINHPKLQGIVFTGKSVRYLSILA